jgi:hypothetical protein
MIIRDMWAIILWPYYIGMAVRALVENQGKI